MFRIEGWGHVCRGVCLALLDLLCFLLLWCVCLPTVTGAQRMIQTLSTTMETKNPKDLVMSSLGIIMADEGLPIAMVYFCYYILYTQVTLGLLYQTCTRLVRGLKHWE